MSARTPREMAQEIVWQWMTTSLDDFTRSCIDDRGITLIEAIAAALTHAEGLAEALEKTARSYHHEKHVVGMGIRLDESEFCTSPVCADARAALATWRAARGGGR